MRVYLTGARRAVEAFVLDVELPDLDGMLERLWRELQNASEVRV